MNKFDEEKDFSSGSAEKLAAAETADGQSRLAAAITKARGAASPDNIEVGINFLNARANHITDNTLDALSWEPTEEEADAYLRGKGVIKKCEVCGQDATLTNDFVTHVMKRYQAKCEELNIARAGSEAKLRERSKAEQIALAGIKDGLKERDRLTASRMKAELIKRVREKAASYERTARTVASPDRAEAALITEKFYALIGELEAR